MAPPKSKNAVGLGNSLMNDRFGKGKGSDRKKASYSAAAVQRTGPNGETYITNPNEEASWVKMRSITEQGALDEFLSTAELAGTDFTAEKLNNVKIIHTDQRNPYLLSAADERAAVKKHQRNRGRLTVPRRPQWDKSTTPQQLDRMERESLLEWRRGLAELQEHQDLLLTPFERNLEVWRQLWRVIERSDLVVQIVDARNPLLFRSEDLEKYVKEVDPRKRNLLLVNKADMMTEKQRDIWADYFEEHGINYKFFSAALAKESLEAMELANKDMDKDVSEEEELADNTKRLNIDDAEVDSSEEESETDEGGPLPNLPRSRTQILTIDELEELFLTAAPHIQKNEGENGKPKPTTVGLVGYPNVGKSSTINALLGAKKVSVSATPGKTKHFQTLYLSPNLLLCDCPGLVFPNFATTKAELVVNGVLPIDQLREFLGPAGIVAKRIPKPFLEAVYGFKINMRPLEEGGTGVPTASEVLRAYARARGFATTGLGQPDESRAARYVLKDYVSGKLLFCHPPPTSESEVEAGKKPIDPAEFNRELYDISHLPPKRRDALLNQGLAPSLSGYDESSSHADTDADTNDDTLSLPSSIVSHPQGARSRNLDTGFFSSVGSGGAGHVKMPFSYQYTEQGAIQRQKELSGRKQRMMVALENGVDPSELSRAGKKHFKGGKRKEIERRKKALSKTGEEDFY
ncbi:ribosome biogenesis GTPase Lsg1 [Blastomyces dermatitidis ATCC 18188]|uniref:Ribosome biogenesis GTPase Lsg1 n=1 Tax=Ajellomyces dermatitidis (strain ATCC 18188 / CBS 674.68) TaxID=653446 RepID=F2TS96_AJEDA|nr:ribosome biogenesis GTPase Lsg1 [Blastomyces dermatitidis ATCC 18188]